MGVGHRPIEILPSQGLPPILAVICDPSLPLVIPLSLHNSGQVGPEVRREVVEAEVVGMGSVTVAETFVAAAANIPSPAPDKEKIGRLEIVADDVV